MSNKTDDVEQDAAFALAEMHRLRAEVKALQASVAWYDNAANEERKRAERAERERDEYLCALGYNDETPRPPPAIVKHRINQLRRDLGAVVDERNDANDALERAEEDNAALLEALRSAREALGKAQVEIGWGTPARLACGRAYDAAGAVATANHPGAALLERLRALEKVREAIRLQTVDGMAYVVVSEDIAARCAAADALKGET